MSAVAPMTKTSATTKETTSKVGGTECPLAKHKEGPPIAAMGTSAEGPEREGAGGALLTPVSKGP